MPESGLRIMPTAIAPPRTPLHPVAELVAVGQVEQFAPFDQAANRLRGLLDSDDHLHHKLADVDEPPRDPFA